MSTFRVICIHFFFAGGYFVICAQPPYTRRFGSFTFHIGAPPPDAFGLKLKPTGSREVMVNVSESGSQNILIETKNLIVSFTNPCS